jgi:hypothetical protein
MDMDMDMDPESGPRAGTFSGVSWTCQNCYQFRKGLCACQSQWLGSGHRGSPGVSGGLMSQPSKCEVNAVGARRTVSTKYMDMFQVPVPSISSQKKPRSHGAHPCGGSPASQHRKLWLGENARRFGKGWRRGNWDASRGHARVSVCSCASQRHEDVL